MRAVTAFDFNANPAINPPLIHTLAKGDWIRKGEPLCLIGDSDTGKTTLRSDTPIG